MLQHVKNWMSFGECHVCGRPAAGEAIIEGSRVSVCNSCARYGQPVAQAKKVSFSMATPKPQEEWEIVENAAKKVRDTRLRKQITIAQLAQETHLSEHDLQRVEDGKLNIDVKIASRLEKVLGVKLLSMISREERDAPKAKPSAFSRTLGDFLKK